MITDPILVTSILIILPLIPAAVIYLILTPSKSRNKSGANNPIDGAQGEYSGDLENVGRVSVKFNLFGSSATYIVLLMVAYFIHSDMKTKELSRLEKVQAIEYIALEKEKQKLALTNHQAWRVDIPIRLMGEDDKPVELTNDILKQVRLELLPNLSTPHSKKLKFWVVADNGSFPSVRFNIPKIVSSAVEIDLNNMNIIDHNYENRKMVGIQPVWINLRDTYDKRPDYGG